ncbi:30S ribosomal protein S5 [bacterium]|nr:30S ribosomal protein S5 [bacterium]
MDTKSHTGNKQHTGGTHSSGSFPSRGGPGGARKGGSRGGPGGGGRGGGGKGGKGGRGGERYKPEYDQKLLNVRRVARVVSGGRRFSFAVALVAGNRKGKVGVGTGKAGDTSLAIEKAFTRARKNLVTIHLTDSMSIPHETSAKYSSAQVLMMPSPGRGLVAGSSVRTVLELLGATDVTTKLLSRTKNPLNNARAAIKALQKLRPARKKVVTAPVVVEETSIEENSPVESL